eukprot:COSAG06_NODE_765_length_12475_cov_85.409502_3_plen_521_part_00
MVAVAGLSVCVGLSESQTPVCSSEQYSVAVAGGGAYCVECTTCGGGQKCVRQGAAAGCVDCPANTYNPDGDPVTGCLGAHRNNQRPSCLQHCSVVAAPGLTMCLVAGWLRVSIDCPPDQHSDPGTTGSCDEDRCGETCMNVLWYGPLGAVFLGLGGRLLTNPDLLCHPVGPNPWRPALVFDPEESESSSSSEEEASEEEEEDDENEDKGEQERLMQPRENTQREDKRKSTHSEPCDLELGGDSISVLKEQVATLTARLAEMEKVFAQEDAKTAQNTGGTTHKEGEVRKRVEQLEATKQERNQKQEQIRKLEKQQSANWKAAATTRRENRLDSSQEVSDDQMGRTDSSPRRGNTADKTSVLLSKRVESERQKPAEPGKLKSSKATKEPTPTRTTGSNRRATSTRTRVQEPEPEPEPVTPSEGSVVVEGAGTDSFNGIYKPSGKLRGKTKYCRTGGGETLEWERGTWTLLKLHVPYYAYSSPPGVTPAQDQPPSDGWTVMPMSAGKEPSPTVRVASGADLAV